MPGLIRQRQRREAAQRAREQNIKWRYRTGSNGLIAFLLNEVYHKPDQLPKVSSVFQQVLRLVRRGQEPNAVLVWPEGQELSGAKQLKQVKQAALQVAVGGAALAIT